MPLAVWILALVQPLIARVLITLGFSIVSVVGVTAALDGLKAQFLAYASQIPAMGLQLALLGGAGEGAGIIFGACATRLALWGIANSTRILARSN